MKPFKNESHQGNEKALRRGHLVPDGDINLAYIKAPELTPKDNIVIVDTSRLVEENVVNSGGSRCKLYYANALGVLVDENDNAVIPEEFPTITDTFAVDEDFNENPGSEYTDADILPYRHVSRHFHLDNAGLTIAGEELEYDTDHIKVVDERGIEYSKYKIKIVAAYLPGNTNDGDTWAYRVFAYVDVDDNENLYLRYNKIELDDETSALVNRQTDYQEILNPEPFFEYVPEESDVVDPNNRRQKIYSTKPLSFKNSVMGRGYTGADGFKAYVPKKAIGDPRLYQLFRWRIVCEFKQDVTVDPSEDTKTLNCGVLVTNKELNQKFPSYAPYALYNLQNSNYNVSNVTFINPAKDSHGEGPQTRSDYWFVNLDEDDLSEYDFLIWAPHVSSLDYSDYSAKINDFVKNKGGTVFIDTSTYCDFNDTLGGKMSRPRKPNGQFRWGPQGNSDASRVDTHDYKFGATGHPLLDGDDELGGWQINKSVVDLDIFGYPQKSNGGISQCFSNTPTGYNGIIQSKLVGSADYKNVLISTNRRRGNKIICTMGILYMVNRTWDHQTGAAHRANVAGRLNTEDEYQNNINGAFVEGGMKILYNAALMALRGKTIDNADETAYSTTWEYTTDWFSSWVIDGDVLSRRERAQNAFEIDAKDIHAGNLEPIWKRKLSTKTYKQLVDETLAPILANPRTRNRIDNATRTYRIEVTNPFVETSSVLVDNDYPKAYTEAYSPRFEVPVELGPHIIKEEVDEQGRVGRVAKYDNVTYNENSYPEEPYSCRVSATYIGSEEAALSPTANYTATGTAVATVKQTQTIPAKTVVTSSDVELSWWDARVESISNPGDPTTAGGAFRLQGGALPDVGMIKPRGIKTWQEANYYTNAWGPGNQNWPHWNGSYVRLVIGSSGDIVRFVQDALNRFKRAGYFSAPHGKLVVDGIYGSKTSNTVRALQNKVDARYVDGVIDAETWYIIGGQVNRLIKDGKLGRTSNSNYTKFFRRAPRMQLHRISNGKTNAPTYAKRSWVTGGPKVIWELFSITYDKKYKWKGISLYPYLEGNTQTMMVRSIHVTNERSLTNYNSTWGQMIYMPHRPRNGRELYIPFGPYTGDTIIVGVGQDRPTGRGSSRMFGVREIAGHTRITDTTTIPAKTKITYKTINIEFQVNGTVSVDSFEEKTVNVQPPKFTEYHSVDNVTFNSIVVDNANIVADINSKGVATFTTNIVDISTESGVRRGPRLGVNSTLDHISKDENGKLNKVREIGWISRAEGIKLLCDREGAPVGFPNMPTGVRANEAQRHYTDLRLNTKGTSKHVTVGFYDIKQQEFVGSYDGQPEMPYIEYISRGPQNIYVAVVTDYQVTKEKVVPVDEDAPRLPYKWAMPVYGVCIKGGSKISLDPLPSRLGAKDVWPIAVREGRFKRDVQIPTRVESKLAGFASGYQGSTLTAFYDIPEAELGGYSTVYGRPNFDIVNEEPIVVDDDVIQVRQAPILMARYPTGAPNPADPFRPALAVYTRDSVSDPWVKLADTGENFSKIKDYNVSTGEIFLAEPLTSNDTNLLRVDYTSKLRSYYFKKHEDQVLNLNSFSGHTRDLIGDAIHVYIVPHYVRDSRGEIISESFNERTLRMTLDPNIFNPTTSDYDPLAIRLGVVYQSTALDIRDVSVLDTRRRGGGVRDDANMQEVSRLVTDSISYWDTGYATGSSYPRSGYIIVRLPEELRDDFTEEEIRHIIEKNITSSVGFKLETISGESWN